MGVKEKINGTTSSIKDQLGYLKKDSVFIKKILETKNIKMMLSEEITDPVPGFKVILGYVYFFQNKKFIN